MTVTRGGNVSLLCDADGVPRPALSWLKDGRPITGQQPGVAVLDQGRLLQITAAKVSDTGRYGCVAVNAAGQADSRQDVSVHGETRPHAVLYCSTVLQYILYCTVLQYCTLPQYLQYCTTVLYTTAVQYCTVLQYCTLPQYILYCTTVHTVL